MQKQLKKTGILLVCMIGMMVSLTGCQNTNKKKQEAYKKQGIAAMTKEDYKGAVSDFKKALALGGNRVDSEEIDLTYYKAAAQYLNKDFNGAKNSYTALIRYDKKNADPYFLRGCLYANEDEIKRAVQDYQKAVAINPADYDLYIQIYENLNELGYEKQAKTFLDRGLKVEGTKKENAIGRGRIEYILKNYKAAKSEFQKGMDQGSSEAGLYLAEVYVTEGETKKAKTLVKKYTKANAMTSESYNTLGNIQMDCGDYQGALSSFEKGLKQKSVTNKKELMKNEIAALEHTGAFKKALAKARTYIKKYPEDRDILNEITFLKTRVKAD